MKKSFVWELFQLIWLEPCMGKRNERRAVDAFNGEFDDVPLWVRSVRNAYRESAGIDIYVYTDLPGRAGSVWVQIKSSQKSADRFIYEQTLGMYDGRIVVVVIQDHFTPEQVRGAIIAAARPAYNKILEKQLERKEDGQLVKNKHITYIAA